MEKALGFILTSLLIAALGSSLITDKKIRDSVDEDAAATRARRKADKLAAKAAKKAAKAEPVSA